MSRRYNSWWDENQESELLTLRDTDDLDFSAIAKRLGRTGEAVYVRYRLLRNKRREHANDWNHHLVSRLMNLTVKKTSIQDMSKELWFEPHAILEKIKSLESTLEVFSGYWPESPWYYVPTKWTPREDEVILRLLFTLPDTKQNPRSIRDLRLFGTPSYEILKAVLDRHRERSEMYYRLREAYIRTPWSQDNVLRGRFEFGN